MSKLTYNKITRAQAISQTNKEFTVVACASKLNPYFLDGVFTYRIEKGTINDTWIKQFKYYNCNKECGTAISFYSVTSNKG